MYSFSIVALRNYYKHISWRQMYYLTVLRLEIQAQCDAAGSWLWVPQGWAEDVGRAAFSMESQRRKYSQARSGWQNSVSHGYWIEVPISLLALGWRLFSTSRGWLPFAGGLLLPSSKLATVKSRRVESFSRFESLWRPAPPHPSASSHLILFGLAGGHISSNSSDCMDWLPSSPYPSPQAFVKVFLEVPQGACHTYSWDEDWLFFSLPLLLLRVGLMTWGPPSNPG